MRISKFQVKGYKSLRSVQLEPSQLTVLVGPNNSGKSNIVDALDFLSIAYRTNPKTAIDSKGGFENIAYRSSGEIVREISFRVEAIAERSEVGFLTRVTPRNDAVDSGKPDRIRFRHEFSLRGIGENLVSDFEVSKEVVQLESLDPAPQVLLRATRSGSRARYTKIESGSGREAGVVLSLFTDNAEIASDMLKRFVQKRTLILDQVKAFTPTLFPFAEHISQMRVYQLSPRECRVPSVPDALANLSTHGSNLPALVYYLREQHPELWRRALQSMSEIVHGLADITIEGKEDRLWSIRFRQLNGDNWSANEVSDGTIRTLGLIATMFDPRASLLAIEEPENSVHPWVLRRFTDICEEIAAEASERQLVVTTHSPVLINHAQAKDVMVVWREHGETKVSPLRKLDNDLESLLESGDVQLFDVLDSGLLSAAVPDPQS